jgi:hypothetical protein
MLAILRFDPHARAGIFNDMAAASERRILNIESNHHGWIS